METLTGIRGLQIPYDSDAELQELQRCVKWESNPCSTCWRVLAGQECPEPAALRGVCRMIGTARVGVIKHRLDPFLAALGHRPVRDKKRRSSALGFLSVFIHVENLIDFSR